MRHYTDANRQRRGGWLPAVIAAVLIVVGCVGIGCNGSSDGWKNPGPETTFEQFLMHWFRNNPGDAYEMIRPEDREALTESLEFVEQKVGPGVLEPREMLVAGRVDNPYDLEDINVEPKLEREPEPGQIVTLSLVYHDGRRGEATMFWDGDRWFIDLPLDEGDSEPTDDATGRKSPADEPSPGEDESSPERPTTDASDGPDAVSGENRE